MARHQQFYPHHHAELALALAEPCPYYGSVTVGGAAPPHSPTQPDTEINGRQHRVYGGPLRRIDVQRAVCLPCRPVFSAT